MSGDCRHCQGWKGCPGQWYPDDEGEETEWYSYGDISWCPHQAFWILKHSEDFDCGRWPKPPRSLECDIKKHAMIVTEAAFCRPKRIIAEVRVRLTRCGDKGRILERDAILREKMMYLDDDITQVLYYVSGRSRKDTPLRTWRAMRRYRNDNKKAVA